MYKPEWHTHTSICEHFFYQYKLPVITWIIYSIIMYSMMIVVNKIIQFSSVTQPCPTLCDPWTAACQVSLSITNSQSLPKLMSIDSVIPSIHLILCHLLLLLSIFPSIRVFSNESALHIRWPKYWSFSFNISPSQDWSPSEWTGWISLQSKGLSRVFSNTTVQKHQFFGAQISL